jgi:putative ABC transport system permease protein
MGASIRSLWQMLSRDFVILVLISCLIAVPVSWYLLQDWLQKFEYRTEISWVVLAASCAGALIITLTTVSYQAVKAALANPVNSLRSE